MTFQFYSKEAAGSNSGFGFGEVALPSAWLKKVVGTEKGGASDDTPFRVGWWSVTGRLAICSYTRPGLAHGNRLATQDIAGQN